MITWKRFLIPLAVLGLVGGLKAAEVNDFNTTDASNIARFPENMSPSALNDGMRADEGIFARWHKDWNGSLLSTGVTDVYAVAANRTLTTYYDGLTLVFEAGRTNTSTTPTLAADSLTAATITKNGTTALAAGDIQAGQKIKVIYDSDNAVWQITTPRAYSGDVVGPSSSTDNVWTRFDGTTGKAVQNGTWAEDDSGNVTAGGTLAMADQEIGRPVLTDVGETVNAIGSVTTTQSIDLTLGNVATATVATESTISFTNPPASGTAGALTLVLTNGGSQTVTWSNVLWAGGTAPTLTSSGVDVLTFFTLDASNYYGFSAGADMQ